MNREVERAWVLQDIKSLISDKVKYTTVFSRSDRNADDLEKYLEMVHMIDLNIKHKITYWRACRLDSSSSRWPWTFVDEYCQEVEAEAEFLMTHIGHIL